MADDNFPFDRLHTQVDVSFTVIEDGRNLVRADNHLERDAYKRFHKLDRLARKFGGTPAGMSWPTHDRAGHDGYEQFGAAYAFEAGDVNLGSFIRFAKESFPTADITHDEGMIFSPDHDSNEKRNNTQSLGDDLVTDVYISVAETIPGTSSTADKALCGLYHVEVRHGEDAGTAEIMDAALEIWHKTYGVDEVDGLTITTNIEDSFLDAKAESIGSYKMFVDVQPDPKNAVIKAVVHSDDHRRKVVFDAEAFFIRGSKQQIIDLANCGWGGDYAADEVAHWYSDKGRTNITQLLQYVSDQADCGFEVHIDPDDAISWLKQNRPDIELPTDEEEQAPNPGA